MKMKVKTLLALTIVGYAVACAKKNFSLDDATIKASCNSSLGCTVNGGTNSYSYDVTIGGAKVDILIVDDNSASMSFEQDHMAARISSLVSTLESKKIDYRIGVITTDVSATSGNSARSINGNGALQDGNLIAFSDGSYYLTPSSGSSQSNRVSMFSSVIQRPETNVCENFLKSNPNVFSDSDVYKNNCPSNDERPIYAANLAINNNSHSFIRSDAQLAIVILSDEDTRSSQYYSVSGYELSSYDLPSTLISNVKSKYPDKTVAVHSIVVRPGSFSGLTDDADTALSTMVGNVYGSFDPSVYFAAGDSSCLNAQFNQIPGTYVSGSYGYLAALLSKETGGVIGDICASDYSGQLSTIGTNISSQVSELGLRCSNPINVAVTFPNSSSVGYSVSGATVKFNSVLPGGTTVHLTYDCPANF